MNDEEMVKDIERIVHFLNEIDSSYFEQSSYLNLLIDLLTSKQYEAFFEKINGLELWGGSGAIWESEYGMSSQQRKQFDKLLISLLTRLKASNNMGGRAKSVLKILESSK